MACLQRILAVESPVGGDDVQLAIAIQVARRDSVPPAFEFSQTEILGDFAELAMLIAKNADRAPFASQHQLRKTIAIQIGEDGAADQSDLFQLLREHKFAVLIP